MDATTVPDRSAERTELIQTLDMHRDLLLRTARELTDAQARTRSTVSTLTISSLLKHVADTEETWFRFVVEGATAFDGVFPDDGADADPRFALGEQDTLDHLRDRIGRVAGRTEEVLRGVDLDVPRELPAAPWFPPGAAWSARRVTLQVLAEIAQHAGHADMIREALDGAKTMG